MEKLYPFNNNKHYHFLATNDKSLEKYYKWTAQEDDLLIAFKFNSNVWQKTHGESLETQGDVLRDREIYLLELQI